MSKQTTKAEAKAFQKELQKRAGETLKPPHTPTPDYALPWIQGDSTPSDEMGDNACKIYDEESCGNLIADCENPQTAAFIVRAVNNHQSLIEAILCALGGEYVTQDGQRIPMIAGDTRKVLESALTKAEAK